MDDYQRASDNNLLDNIINIGRRRERKIYYREDGSPTKELPADAYSQMYYRSKGFTLKPKARDDVVISGVRCPYCGFEPKNALSLRTHLTKHVNESKEGE
jgi:hypothetical protein